MGLDRHNFVIQCLRLETIRNSTCWWLCTCFLCLIKFAQEYFYGVVRPRCNRVAHCKATIACILTHTVTLMDRIMTLFYAPTLLISVHRKISNKGTLRKEKTVAVLFNGFYLFVKLYGTSYIIKNNNLIVTRINLLINNL